MLEILNLTKNYRNVTAIDNLSFTVNRGRVFGLLGPNGAGKTTTIRIILDIIKPSDGTVKFDGTLVNNRFQDIVGYLPEERGLYKKSKVIDVIEYLAKLKNMPARASLLNAHALMEKLDVWQYKDRRIEELSKGNQQKIQFITALVHKPEILILDEPFSGLDPINQKMIREILLEFIDNGKIVILSTHLLEMAEFIVEDILLLNNGKNILSGSLKEIKKQFSKNSYRIEFTGNVQKLESIPGVIIKIIGNNSAEITLRDLTSSQFLKDASSLIDINHFSYIEPTLKNIFLETIK
ncbi:MAG: ATP-binding cassette domain-containing protein [bacterium]